MISYKVDDNKHYDETIKSYLRSYNEQFVPNAIFDEDYLYAVKDNLIVGYMKINFTWDWVNISVLVYDNVEVLKALTKKAFRLYQDKSIGIKSLETDKNQVNNLLMSNYSIDGKVEFDDTLTYYYMSCFKEPSHTFLGDIIISKDPLKKYEIPLEKLLKKHHQVEEVGIDYAMAALDQDKCIGGVQTTIYDKMIHVNRISVDKDYRHQHIGTTLLTLIIDHAKALNLPFVTLSTTSFQARSFYEKNGFKVMYTRKNHPKGYDAHMLLKRLIE
jgi:ribosomal protein S18 acetylase RimI-like enzyme